MKQLIGVILSIVITILSGLGCIIVQEQIPSEGVWYCEELGITIDRDENWCTTVVDGVEIKCSFGNEPGTSLVSINNQDVSATEYYMGEAFLEGKCVHFDEKTMVICELYTDDLYTFYRTDLETENAETD